MILQSVMDGTVTLEELYRLRDLGYSFVVNNGEVTDITTPYMKEY